MEYMGRMGRMGKIKFNKEINLIMRDRLEINEYRNDYW